MSSPPPYIVVTLAALDELDSRESAIVVWEDGLAAFERALGGRVWNATQSVPKPKLSDRITCQDVRLYVQLPEVL
jgi:hypothetical protein